MKKTFFLVAVIYLGLAAWLYRTHYRPTSIPSPASPLPQFNTPTATPSPTPTPITIPTAYTIPGGMHVYQTFNNCGPASLSMALSYYGVNQTQEQLGQLLRPYQVAHGNNDDKSVILPELADHATTYGFTSYHRPSGTIDILQKFIAHDIPVITRTLTHPDEDIGHYRVVKGYDQSRQVLIQDDSLQGKNLTYTYNTFNILWQQFNYEYLVLVLPEKQSLAEAILGPHLDLQTAWIQAQQTAEAQLQDNPDHLYARFNLAIALYHLNDYQQSVTEYQKIADHLPARTLWYQIEPILAHHQLGHYDQVFTITDKILNNGNRASSELYYLRGQIYQQQQNLPAARAEFEQAITYHSHYQPAIQALAALEQN
jgi:tetratricopeptide (TPR) repeat protein